MPSTRPTIRPVRKVRAGGCARSSTASMVRTRRRSAVLSYPCPSLLGMTVTTDPQPAPADAPEQPAGPSLSPSRAADFKTCPLLFRFRTIDRLPERPTADQVRGTLVHAVLERLFDLPAAERT